jgi:hypothetical protein
MPQTWTKTTGVCVSIKKMSNRLIKKGPTDAEKDQTLCMCLDQWQAEITSLERKVRALDRAANPSQRLDCTDAGP